jgi:hypothetical protein
MYAACASCLTNRGFLLSRGDLNISGSGRGPETRVTRAVLAFDDVTSLEVPGHKGSFGHLRRAILMNQRQLRNCDLPGARG